MNDNQFDDFVNDKLKEYAAPVPAGLWEKVAEGQFDQFIGGKLRNAEAPVPEGLWDKISDGQFDHFVGNTLDATEAPVPSGLWDKISDGQFDSFVAGKLDATLAPIPSGLWDKITDGQFDNFVAGKLKDHEAPVPAGLWEKVRPQQDDDRVGFLWFRYPAAAVLIIALLTAAAWGGYVYFSKKNTTTEATKSFAPKDNSGTSNHTTPEQEVPKTSHDAAAATPLANDGKAGVIDPKTISSSTTIPPATSVSPTAIAKEKASKDAANGTNMSTNPSSSNPIKENTTGAKAAGNPLAPPTPNHNDVTTNSYDIFRNKTVLADKGNDQSTINSSDDPISLPTFQPSFSPASTIPFGLNKYGITTDKQLSTLNHTNQFRSVIICPSDKKGNRDWLVEVYASPDLAMKSVTNISATPLYMLKKDSSESMQIGYSAGVRLVKPITDNILLKAGIQYSQANQKYVYRTENEVKTTTVVTVRTIIRAPGDTVVVHDTSSVQTIGFKNNTVSNRYRSFDIPVTVGYQFGDDDLKFGINAGVILNLSSWYEGVILDSALATVPLNKNGNGVYKSNIGLGLYGSISVVKRLSEDMHIFFEPYFRYNLSNMTTPQASFKQKLNIGGLSVGLRFNLNRK
ncbi:MAG: hypothetical protein ABIS69_03280 [Sediminibacterium sp.]